MTTRDRRALLVGMAVVAGAVLVLRVVPLCLREYRELRTQAAATRATLARARDVVRSEPADRGALADRAGALVALAPKLLSGRTETEATAALTALVTAAAARSELRISRLAPHALTGDGLFLPIGVQAQLEGDVTALAAFLAILESEEPIVTVRELTVRTEDARAGPRGADVLTVEARLVGWRIAGDAS